MLQKIRDNLSGWVAAIPFGLIALAFVFWGVDAPSLIAGNYAAKVNGEEIPMTEFRRALQDQLNQYQQYYADEIPPVLEDSIRQNVLNGFVRRELVDHRVKKARYRVGDEELQAYIRGMQAFQVGGQFSPESYRARLSLLGLTAAGFEADQRKQLAADQLRDAVLQSSFVTESEMRRYLELDGEQREVGYVVLDVNAYINAVSVDETRIIEHYESNRDRYRTEETLTLEYLEVRLDDVAAETVVSEDDVRAYYDTVADRFRTAEQRKARHILIAITADTDAVAAQARAGDAMSRLQAGEDFSAVAADTSDDIDTRELGGDLGWMNRDDMGEIMGNAVADVVFALEAGSLESPVRGEFGYHILQLDAIKKQETQDFESVRSELESEYRRQVAEELFYERADDLEAAAFEAWDELGSVADTLSLPLRQLTDFRRVGAGPFAGNTDVIDAAFDEDVLENGQNSRLIQIGDDNAIVLRVSDHQLAAEKTLDNVRDEIRAELIRDVATQHVMELGGAVVVKARAGGDLDTLLAEIGFSLPAARWVVRSDAAVPTDLLSSTFRAAKPTGEAPVIDGVPLANGNYAIYALTGVRPGDRSAVSITQYRNQSARRRQQHAVGELSAYIGELEAAADIVVGDIDPDQNL